jgi:NAD(P)-dependent dehydrogenase (short-subunit alcohol dehydrogenase family)
MNVPNFRLDGRAAMVTGAGSGIGRAIAVAVAASGASVGCVDLPSADLPGVVADIMSAGGRAAGVPADVTDPDQMTTAVARIEQKLGPLSAAVNAAGIANAAPAEEMSLAQWQRVLDVDLTGVFLSCQAEAKAMITSGGGAIVNIASMSATIANRDLYQAHYNAAKAGVVHLGRSLAWEWAPRGIRVNSISPGYTYTPMTRRPEQAEAMEAYARDTPIGRNAEPEDIAGPAVFLLSPAAGYVTGVDLLVDGGFVIW